MIPEWVGDLPNWGQLIADACFHTCLEEWDNDTDFQRQPVNVLLKA